MDGFQSFIFIYKVFLLLFVLAINFGSNNNNNLELGIVLNNKAS
jgi:hypothetical protein